MTQSLHERPGASAIARRVMAGRPRSALIGAFALLVAGCGGEPVAAPEDGAALVRTGTITRLQSAQTYRLTGVTRAAQQAQLSFQVSGRLAERPADVGDEVAPGDLLARLTTPQLDPAARGARASVSRLETQLANARETTARTQRLVSQDAATQQQLDDARTQRDALAAQLAQARAEAERASQSAEQQRLSAPIAGTVADVFYEPGEFVPAGQPVISISGAGGLEARFGVPEQLIENLATGQAARLSLPLGDGRPLTGRLVRLARATTGPGQLFEAQIHISDTAHVRAGESVVWHVHGPSRDDLLAPISALARIGTARAAVVYVIRDGRAHRVPVTPGAVVDDRVRLSGDLDAGDTVAIAGLSHLADGRAVREAGPDDD